MAHKFTINPLVIKLVLAWLWLYALQLLHCTLWEVPSLELGCSQIRRLASEPPKRLV